MALVKFVHLLAVLSFAILQVSFVTLPANALAVERDHIGRDHVHAGIIKRQGGSSKRCKPRKGSNKLPTHSHNLSTNYEHTSTPTSTSTTTTLAHQTPTSTPSGGSKRILLWSHPQESSLRNFIKPHSDIIICNWQLAPYPSDALGASEDVFQTLQFLPIFWGRKQADIDYSYVLRSGTPRYPFIGGMNEPNIQRESNLSPQEAADIWKEYLEPLAKYSQLLSPAVTGDRPDWMADFMKACDKCSVSAMVIHIYEINPETAIGYANTFRQQFDMNLWIGEIACHSFANKGKCDQATFDKFYNTVVGFFDITPWVQRYAWFGAFPDGLPDGVDSVNQMMYCSDSKNDPNSCFPTEFGRKYLAGQ